MIIKQTLESGPFRDHHPGVESAEQAKIAVRNIRFPQQPGSKLYLPRGDRPPWRRVLGTADWTSTSAGRSLAYITRTARCPDYGMIGARRA